jgi:DNA-binding NtrC family response regulator
MNEPPKRTVLVIDDRDDLLEVCARTMGGDLDFLRARNAREAGEVLRTHEDLALVLLDRDFSHADPAGLLGPIEEVRYEGMRILRWLKSDFPNLPVLMVTAFREQGAALAAAELWTDYLVWEDIAENPEILPARVRRLVGTDGEETERILAAFRELGVIGRAPAFARTLLALHRTLSSDKPILLTGETGTGKDLLAWTVHSLSGDRSRPFVALNVNALPAAMLEDELFGHVRGAYTGAESDRLGKLRLAHGGTLFLNEVADLRLDLQAKLLSAVEHSEVVPVGGDRAFPAVFRLITASSHDLLARVDRGRFRKDLYHRLAWNSVTIPPLRERREDIPPLIRCFLGSGARRTSGANEITREAEEYLSSLSWSGNVRQLRSVVEAASLRGDRVITLLDVREVLAQTDAEGRLGAAPARTPGLSPSLSEGADRAGAAAVGSEEAERILFSGRTHDEVTRKYFLYLLRLTGGNVPEAARIAGISKATAYKWKKQFEENEP